MVTAHVCVLALIKLSEEVECYKFLSVFLILMHICDCKVGYNIEGGQQHSNDTHFQPWLVVAIISLEAFFIFLVSYDPYMPLQSL